jgi:peptidoglycan/LPS O-acetylase OafA/YrhL
MFRRARRILPPYYAALALSLALSWWSPLLSRSDNPRWDVALPAFSLRSAVLPHVFLVHNVRPSWAYKIDPPMWSVAAEWQIYCFFPLLLIVWRKGGIAAAVFVGFFAGLISVPFVPGSVADTGCPWYLGLFTLGMAAAVTTQRLEKSPRGWSDRDGWLALSLICVCACLGTELAIADAFVGAVTAVSLVYLTSRPKDERPVTLRILESRPLVMLGTFSYSLYLVHYPFQAWASYFLTDCQFSPDHRLLLMISGVTPVILIAAYGFHLAFERPFMSRPSKPVHTGALERVGERVTRCHSASRPNRITAPHKTGHNL